MNRERGFALLMVLWTMALLALLVAQFTSTGRSEVRMAANARASAATRAAADGAVHEAVLRLLQMAWLPDARARTVRVGDTMVEVRIRNQAWKINPNSAPLPVIQALLVNLVVEAGRAASLARAIVDWRSSGSRSQPDGPKLAQYQAAGLNYGPAHQLFDNLDEVGLVVGMTPAVLARMKPFMSIYQEGDSTSATDQLSLDKLPSAMEISTNGGDVWHLGSTGRIMVVMIDALAFGPAGDRFTRQAVVRLRAEASLDQAPYQILTWDNPAE